MTEFLVGPRGSLSCRRGGFAEDEEVYEGEDQEDDADLAEEEG